MDRTVSVRRNPRLVALIAVAAAALILLAFAFPSINRWVRAERSVDAASLRLATVTRGDLVRDLSVQGRVVASLSPTLFSPGQGIVTLRTQPGAEVVEGQILATIDSKELQAALDQAEAQLLSTRAQFDRETIVGRQAQLRAVQQVNLLTLRLTAAQRQLERVDRLAREGLSNRSDLEAAQDNVRVVAMELEQAKNELDLSREAGGFEVTTLEQQVRLQESVTAELAKRVEALTIRAPFDGMVAALSVADSDAVAANQPILQVVNLSSLEVEIGLPEAYASETPIGTPAIIASQDREYPARVTAVSPEVVNSQVMARVAFDGERPDGLRQNQRLPVRLTFESKPNVLKVQRGAFIEAGGGRSAWVVNGKMATRREIRTGAASVGEIEITSGLEEGETIIVSDTTAFGNATNVMLR